MRLVVVLSGALLGAVVLSSAGVAQNVISERKAVMKRLGDQSDLGAAMLKGQLPYDPAKAAAIFASYKGALDGYVGLFPTGSDRGETKATPAIWSDRAGFEAAKAAFDKAVAENSGTVGTADGFKASFVAVANACRSCHQSFKQR